MISCEMDSCFLGIVFKLGFNGSLIRMGSLIDGVMFPIGWFRVIVEVKGGIQEFLGD